MLHTQLTQCITTIKNTTPSCNDILPESSSSFFTYYQHESTVPVSGLQSALNSRATGHLFNAAIDRAESKSDIATIAINFRESQCYISTSVQSVRTAPGLGGYRHP